MFVYEGWIVLLFSQFHVVDSVFGLLRLAEIKVFSQQTKSVTLIKHVFY